MPATASQKIIDVKEAVQIASRRLCELYPRTGAADIGLEEVEIEGSHWEVTLSFTNPRPQMPKLGQLFGVGEDRVYKKFGVDKRTGEVLFMRIRKP